MTVKNADAAISISKFLQGELKKKTGLDSEVRYVKIDHDRFNSGVAAKHKKQIDGVIKAYELESPVLLYVGRISPHKGVHLLLDAFKLVREELPSATLIIVGKHTFAKYSQQLQKKASEIGGVAFAGFIPDDDLPAFYGACDVYVTCSLWEGFDIPVCLTAKAQVKCDNGYTAINKIKAGNKVITHRGYEEDVTAISKRAYNGNIKSILVYGCNAPLEITPEHRVYAIRTKRCKTNTVCKPGHKCRKKYYLHYKPEWIEARQLQKGDALLYPYNRKITDKGSLVLKSYLPSAIEKDGRLFYKYSRKTERGKATYEAIGKELGMSKNAIYRYLNHHTNKLSESKSLLIGTHLKRTEYVPRSKITIPKRIKLEGGFLRLFGYYLSEGHSTKTGSTLIFSFHAQEITYQKDVLALVKRIFNIDGNLEIKKNGCRIFFTTQLLNKLFSALGGNGAKNKQIPPEFLQLPSHKLKELIKGLWRGDGCVFNYGNQTIVAFSTTSPKLAEQVRDILLRLGIGCNITIADRKDKGIEYTISVSGHYRYAFCKILGEPCLENNERISHNRYWLDDAYFYTQIRTIQEKPYDGFVYNLEVNRDKSYTILQGTVHNCEANAVGKPAVAFNVGSHPEVLKKGTLVDKGDVRGFADAVVKLLR